MTDAEVGPGRCTSMEVDGVAVKGRLRSTKRTRQKKGPNRKRLGYPPGEFHQRHCGFTINEIGVHTQVFCGVSGARIFVQQL